jgi:aldehyde dehydrogenase (NAD+)
VSAAEADIAEALYADLKKSAYEAYMTEVGPALEEIRFARRRLRRWAKPKRVPTPLIHWPASSVVRPAPLGVCLIIAPWNYPFQLAAAPLAAAIAAGNCAVVKPSELSPHSAAALSRMLQKTFDPGHVAVVEGGVAVSQALLAERFDKIFFTGSPRVGKIVMKAAADHLTPVTLELGGKSPCIVDRDTNLRRAARRIASGKFINAGQTCVAPDYLLVHRDCKEDLLAEMKAAVDSFFGTDPRQSADYPRILNEQHFQRLAALLTEGRIRIGEETDAEQHYIAPTVIDKIDWTAPIMEEEIFGPILPVLPFSTVEEAVDAVRRLPKPLAFYYFGKDAGRREAIMERLSFGGGCVNDTLLHLATPHLPFGGVGPSGMGAYHGRAGFDAFSHRKGLLKRTFFPDAPMRYPPFSNWKMRVIKRLLR